MMQDYGSNYNYCESGGVNSGLISPEDFKKNQI